MLIVGYCGQTLDVTVNVNSQIVTVYQILNLKYSDNDSELYQVSWRNIEFYYHLFSQHTSHIVIIVIRLYKLHAIKHWYHVNSDSTEGL